MALAAARILIVDDEESIRFGMREYLEGHGYSVLDADSCEKARELFQVSSPDVAVIDYRLHDGTALDLLRDFKQFDPDVPLVVLTAYGSIDLAVQAVKEGAEQFLTKPIELPTLQVILKRLLANRKLVRQQQVSATRENRDLVNPLAGVSPAIQALAEQARKVAGSDSPILILGETGTGKTALAKWLHHHGPRVREPFVDLNCAGLTPEFLEAELFGHEKGAFTGAAGVKQGLLEIADGGTAFLDEIGDVDPRVQPKLLKALEEKRFRRMGAVRERAVDIALIAATHQDLGARVKAGLFRSDLYFRISSIPLTIPPLRERRQDIGLLTRNLLRRLVPDHGRSMALTPDAERALVNYAWPGNIRELRNVLERAVLLCQDDTITRDDLRFEVAPVPDIPGTDTSLTLQQVELRYIERVLREVGGKVEQASQRLGIPRSTLYQKIKTHGIVIGQNDPC